MVVCDVILPCLDEAAALPYVLERMPAGYRAIVVDNGSTDGSAALASSLGATVVSASVKGFGSACFRRALGSDGRAGRVPRLRRLDGPRRSCRGSSTRWSPAPWS